MSGNDNQGLTRKEALRKLREARKENIARATLRVKEQRRAIDALKRELATGGKTVPELAERAGISSSEAMWYVATLKKYGELGETEKDGGYFRYELVDAEGTSTPDRSTKDEPWL